MKGRTAKAEGTGPDRTVELHHRSFRQQKRQHVFWTFERKGLSFAKFATKEKGSLRGKRNPLGN